MYDGVDAYAYGSYHGGKAIELLSEVGTACSNSNMEFKIHTKDSTTSYTLKQNGSGNGAFEWKQGYTSGDKFRFVELNTFDVAQ